MFSYLPAAIIVKNTEDNTVQSQWHYPEPPDWKRPVGRSCHTWLRTVGGGPEAIGYRPLDLAY